ncbi:hypothetical protein A2715_03725 [Candidatus Woesebacteria bacterium RIFCSPHIGHO2_01_FULL_39_32]|uniref:ATP-dependent exonuclase V beta subunit, helicase and exonuclease domain-containing n=2 Tax=Candidatus Woeseibacteriota TaxID=1752722 RepID=A0A0G0PKU1_9BACT|nr:MAG: ATP-dependent exonuclase V beta subunit, helicase and exonuclease domain-containing [Candidatus Woesebacteria bacterium GW2011_GWA1_39_8]OGM05080.1 MAG: hypothetical protein A2124_05035 [Candidatus Woesebacteria bacterium GWB1_37_5]OGM24848.1 MAG: hypothetical protein A2715_03725 [Candidatus Woesebacteria bacterium RIFCSPHIGHO2_01_FULL_39_32]OGM64674.1 MAG: hypothetical protein A2893_06640 [Candidatus Woesebacteria bacterium RIFCSPLOWO2_01_FULL_39_25]
MGTVNSSFFASPYKLSMFLECPRKYWYYYINEETKYKQPEHPYFTMGGHVHDTLKNFFNLDVKFRSKEKILELLETFWKRKSGREGGFESKEEEEHYKGRARKMLVKFFDNGDIKAKPILWHSQSNPKVEVTPSLFFTGVFDRIDVLPRDVLHVIDYKTGKEDAVDERNIQLPMYAVLAERIFRKPVTQVSYLNLESGRWDTRGLEKGYAFDTIGRVQEIVAKIPKSSEKEDFICGYKDRCFHCNYLKELGFNLE